MKFKQIALTLAFHFLSSNVIFSKAEQINKSQSEKIHESELESDKKDLGYCCVNI